MDIIIHSALFEFSRFVEGYTERWGSRVNGPFQPVLESRSVASFHCLRDLPQDTGEPRVGLNLEDLGAQAFYLKALIGNPPGEGLPVDLEIEGKPGDVQVRVRGILDAELH